MEVSLGFRQTVRACRRQGGAGNGDPGVGARGGPRALNLPRAVAVRTGEGGVPLRVDGRVVELVRESWLVEDRWWTSHPLRRRYWEVVSADGRNLVVFHDLTAGAGRGGWFVQGP
jgi:hypothetical protein